MNTRPFNNLIFIGMPSSGKSTLGKQLAEHFSLTFLDTDDSISQRHGCSLQEIINQQGYKAFRQLEEDELLHLCRQNHLIATGGSAVYSKRGMAHLATQGLIIYLSINLATLENRLNNASSRGLASAKDQSLADIYHERLPLYERYADITIDNNGSLSILACVKAIETYYKQQGSIIFNQK